MESTETALTYMLRADAIRAIYPELEPRIVVTIMGAVAAEL